MENNEIFTLEANHPLLGKIEFHPEFINAKNPLNTGEIDVDTVEITFFGKNGEKKKIQKIMSKDGFLKMIEELSSNKK